jgi:hypothetical protein
MGIDVSSRGIRRIADSAESNTQSVKGTPPQKQDLDSQQELTPSKLQNQNSDAANSRKAEGGLTANQMQSQLLNQTNSTGANRTKSNAADVQKAMKMYGITDEQLQRYIVTGEQPEGLKKAINDASTKGEHLAVNVVRESFQKRAEYLRKNHGPNAKESHAEADQLQAAVASLEQNRNQIATKSAEARLKSAERYGDAERPANVQTRVVQAARDLQEISAEMQKKIEAQPAHLRKKTSY